MWLPTPTSRTAMPEATVCLGCGALTTGPRNGRCRRCYRPKPTHPAYREAEYRRNRDQLIKEWVSHAGWYCPGLTEAAHPGHPVAPGDLDADHIVPVLRGGGHGKENLRVLCKGINRARRSQRSAEYNQLP